MNRLRWLKSPLASQLFASYRLQARGIASAAHYVEPVQHDSPDRLPVARPAIREELKASNKSSRLEAVREAKPFSEFLTDNFNREHDYLRISVTEKCNLRCLYCMPEEGVSLSPASHLLSSPEIQYISSLFVSEGVTKIRLTGGEPTVRSDIVPLMRSLGDLRRNGLEELCITTNGISLHRKLDSMVESGLTGVNLSLDTLDPFQFQIMTRRKGFEAVMKSIDRILEMKRLGAPLKLKINAVIMRGMNEREILPFVELGREKDIEVRFIEYMPFDGNKWSRNKMLGYQEMLAMIQEKYPDLAKVKNHKNDTSRTYKVPGFVGQVGFITSMTQNFCGSCNRLRITSDGNLKVCLFGNAEVSLRDMIRQSNDGAPLDAAALERLEAMQAESPQTKQALLDVIGMAVKRKKAQHAGMGTLENMKNRPMILIDESHRSRVTSGSSWARRSLQPAMWQQMPPLSRLQSARFYSSNAYRKLWSPAKRSARFSSSLTHIDGSGQARMVSVGDKDVTSREAIARGRVTFSNPAVEELIASNALKKGDVLSVARIAGIMAAKKTAELIPLCHPIGLTSVKVDLQLESGAVEITATVQCDGKTGVEMEALTAVTVSALTVYDMCKAVDKGMKIEQVRVVSKKGGKSGDWTAA